VAGVVRVAVLTDCRVPRPARSEPGSESPTLHGRQIRGSVGQAPSADITKMIEEAVHARHVVRVTYRALDEAEMVSFIEPLAIRFNNARHRVLWCVNRDAGHIEDRTASRTPPPPGRRPRRGPGWRRVERSGQYPAWVAVMDGREPGPRWCPRRRSGRSWGGSARLAARGGSG
jgi:hypothetical protein